MEFPISFFLDYAWNPTAIQADQLQQYTEQWCVQQFGSSHANEIASLLSQYTKYNGRVKPELLNAKTYCLENYNEFATVVKQYQQHSKQASSLAVKLEASQQEAYYQLVLHPVTASANLYEMYYYLALNSQAVANNNLKANSYADKVKEHYKKDSLITKEYHQCNNGKWNHMMSQTHIGYTYWQQPPVNKMPAVRYLAGWDKVEPTRPSRSVDAMHLIPKKAEGSVFYEKDNYVSIEASHTTRVANQNGITWQVLPNHGRTASAITPFPVTASKQNVSSSSPYVEYDFYTYSQGEAKLQLYFSPTLNFHHSSTGLQHAISIDHENPQVVGLNAEDSRNKIWEHWVTNNIIVKTSTHQFLQPGKHTIKFWMIDPGVVLQKLVLDLGGVKPSYLGPPETKYEKLVK